MTNKNCDHANVKMFSRRDKNDKNWETRREMQDSHNIAYIIA